MRVLVGFFIGRRDCSPNTGPEAGGRNETGGRNLTRGCDQRRNPAGAGPPAGQRRGGDVAARNI